MKKKLIILMLLVSIDICGFLFFVFSLSKKEKFEIEPIYESIVFPIKELKFEVFDFNSCFYTKHVKDIKYDLKEDYVDIQYLNCNQALFKQRYKVQIIKPIKETQNTINHEDIKKLPINENIQTPINTTKPSENLYFDGYHDISLPIDSSLDTLVSSLLKDIKTNQNVSINYANVNLSSIGTYPVYYYVNDKTYTIHVTIY